jgi:hypothetical protein
MCINQNKKFRRKNYGNNGIYGRVSNFFGTSCLDPVALSLRSGEDKMGYVALGVAPLPPKLPSATSFIRKTLSETHLENFERSIFTLWLYCLE